MIVTQNHTSTVIDISPDEGLEMIRQLANVIAHSVKNVDCVSFVLPGSVSIDRGDTWSPGVVQFTVRSKR